MSLAILDNSCKIHDSRIYAILQDDFRAIEGEEKLLLIWKDMDAFQFERIFVQVVEEIARKKGLNASQLARAAWPHQKAGAAAWRKMRNNQEKPKRLNIEEAVLLTQAIGMSMADVCGIVQARILQMTDSASFEATPRKAVLETNSAEERSESEKAHPKKGAPERAVLAAVQADLG